MSEKTREEIKEEQSKNLIALVKRVYENVPYYKKKMQDAKVKPSDIKSIDDITKLPFTTKQDLRDNYPFGTFAVPMQEIVRLHASSGTTGKLTVAGYTKNDLDMWAETVKRCLEKAGVTKDDILHIAFGYGLFTGGLGLHYGAEKLGCTVVPAAAGNTIRQIQLLKDFKATVLVCTPSYALVLHESIKKAGMDMKDFNLRLGIFGAEPWSLSMKKDIEQKFGIQAFDIYGLSEISGPGVAISCKCCDMLHVWDDIFYPEVVDTKTLESLSDGEEGELVFTTLQKEGMPLIRYRTRDITILEHKKCKSGHQCTHMRRITGRSDDMLIIRGVNVFPSQIESVLFNINEIEAGKYLIVLDRVSNLDTMEIQVELKKEYFSDTISDLDKIRKNIENQMIGNLGVGAKIVLKAPGSIQLSDSKTQRIIDNRTI